MRLSQIYWYLTAEKHPSETEILHTYSHLVIGPEIKKFRRQALRSRTRSNIRTQPLKKSSQVAPNLQYDLNAPNLLVNNRQTL
jgi:hypothetical protein